jgi:hypothetical protein
MGPGKCPSTLHGREIRTIEVLQIKPFKIRAPTNCTPIGIPLESSVGTEAHGRPRKAGARGGAAALIEQVLSNLMELTADWIFFILFFAIMPARKGLHRMA